MNYTPHDLAAFEEPMSCFRIRERRHDNEMNLEKEKVLRRVLACRLMISVSRRATFPQCVRCVCLSLLRPCSQCQSRCSYPCEACRTRLPRSHPHIGWTKNAFLFC